VDGQTAQVAIVIPADFSKKFADTNKQAAIEFYQDPTLTIGPSIIRSILNRFMDGMAGVKIAINVFMDEAPESEYYLTGDVIQRYLDISLVQTKDVAGTLLDERAPTAASSEQISGSPASQNLLLRIVGPIMGGMMIMYAFFTGSSTAQSILKEEEERTLPRLFTTPTPQAVILTGKLVAVFLTVLVQVVVLIIAARLIFGIQWGAPVPVAMAAAGTVFIASSFGIFINSLLKTTKQGGTVFGGVLVMTGMLGMISVFAVNSPTAARLGNTVSLLVPQGWAVRGLVQAMNGAPVANVGLTALVMLVLSAAFFVVGVWRFSKRYA
jgi:ABC-2 type transport system permease protein